jgi:hypothetical protein
MNVICHYRNDPERPLDDPVPELNGRAFVFRLYSGDWLDPIFSWGSNWFKKPYPKRVLHLRVSLPVLPFIAWRWPFSNRAGYLGFKRYGVDAQEYKEWLCDPAEVYEGSKALCLSCRPFARIHP